MQPTTSAAALPAPWNWGGGDDLRHLGVTCRAVRPLGEVEFSGELLSGKAQTYSASRGASPKDVRGRLCPLVP